MARRLFVSFVVAALGASFMSTSGLVASESSKIFTLPLLVTFGLLVGLTYLVGTAYGAIFGEYYFYGDEGRDSYLIRKAPAGMTRETGIAEMKRSRKVGAIPPVYPNGWFAVLRSAELKKMETKYVHALGLHLAVFRGESGKVYITDAYCPHLGANLAIGGKVKGECIECPFHGWTYRGDDGKCVKIGYAEKVPDFVKVDTHRCHEVAGFICVWFHAEKEEPSWYPLEGVEAKMSTMGKVGFFEAYVECHAQDIIENGGDIPHLNVVHGPQIYEKHYTGTFEQHETKKHIGITASSFVRKDSKGLWSYFSPAKKEKREQYQEQHGPGLSFVHFGKELLVIANTPVGPLRQKVTFTLYSPYTKGLKNAIVNKLRLYFNFLVLQGDFVIWANKTYLSKPQYVKEDSPTVAHRRWFSQFYTEHSPRYNPPDPLQW
ncbi:cholesterol 7-desaturase-like [Patiria miniata]|uniref:cholesterol 7-desaturase n=1 Tax=Patiria miniata TaxID=46514 RepID=A0A913ZS53_PATMI|nr:cholesterol 7-desaturase-like [Patiria miniata]